MRDWHAEEVSVVERPPSTGRDEVGMTLVMEGLLRLRAAQGVVVRTGYCVDCVRIGRSGPTGHRVQVTVGPESGVGRCLNT